MQNENVADVIIIGGGMSGLSAAHELAKVGLSVAIYEKSDNVGGKMRNYYDEQGKYLGEHGFRVFTGRYFNTLALFDELGIRNNLQASSANHYLKDCMISCIPAKNNFSGIKTLFKNFWLKFKNLGIKDFLGYISAVKKIIKASQLSTKDLDVLDNITIAQYLEIDKYPPFTRSYFHRTCRFTNAIDINEGSIFCLAQQTGSFLSEATRFGGKGFLYSLTSPTTEAFINPWINELNRLGVKINKNKTVREIICTDDKKQVKSIKLEDGKLLHAKCFIIATQLEEAIQLAPGINQAELLINSHKIFSGIQFHLKESSTNKLPKGSGIHSLLDSPWEISLAHQDKGMWPDYKFSEDFDSILSIVITCWLEKGIKIKKSALDCNREELIEEILFQINYHKNFSIDPSSIVRWYIDPTLLYDKEKNKFVGSSSKLYCPRVGEYKHRPDSVTPIDNLFVCGEYTKTVYQISSMESANESGRRAAKATAKYLGLDTELIKIYE